MVVLAIYGFLLWQMRFADKSLLHWLVSQVYILLLSERISTLSGSTTSWGCCYRWLIAILLLLLVIECYSCDKMLTGSFIRVYVLDFFYYFSRWERFDRFDFVQEPLLWEQFGMCICVWRRNYCDFFRLVSLHGQTVSKGVREFPLLPVVCCCDKFPQQWETCRRPRLESDHISAISDISSFAQYGYFLWVKFFYSFRSWEGDIKWRSCIEIVLEIVN